MSTGTGFAPGRNIAMKVPPHQFQATVTFYRDLLGFRVLESEPASVCFEFGNCRLWIDRVPAMTHAEIWLEVTADDVNGAASKLESAGVVRCDEVESLPEGFNGFWIANPAGVVHLVSDSSE